MKNFIFSTFFKKFSTKLFQEVTLEFLPTAHTQSEDTGMELEGEADQKDKITSKTAKPIKLKGARVYGFKNIQNLVRQIKTKRCKYQYVEIMACPSGCLNGGGQVQYKDKKSKIVYGELAGLMHSPDKLKEYFFENKTIMRLIDEIWEADREWLMYKIKKLDQSANPVAIKW